jgi:hypothetical protein
LAVNNGWKAAVDKINADGGIVVGDTAYQIDFKAEDSKGTTDGAATAATKLALQDNAKFILAISRQHGAGDLRRKRKAGASLHNTLPVNGNDIRVRSAAGAEGFVLSGPRSRMRTLSRRSTWWTTTRTPRK